MRQSGLAGLGLHDRNAVFLGERSEFGARFRIEHAATGDDDRLLRGSERLDCRCQLVEIRLDAARNPDLLVEEGFRIVVGFRLHVLAER